MIMALLEILFIYLFTLRDEKKKGFCILFFLCIDIDNMVCGA